MPKDIFTDTPNWSYTDSDAKAWQKLNSLVEEAIKTLPKQIRDVRIITLFDEIRQTALYPVLKTLPKAVLHHLHFDCNEDQEFYAKYIVNDPIIYLSSDEKSFKIGTEQQAKENGWVTMAAVRTKYDQQETFLKAVSNITMLNRQQRAHLVEKPDDCWKMFEQKIGGFFPILDLSLLV